VGMRAAAFNPVRRNGAAPSVLRRTGRAYIERTHSDGTSNPAGGWPSMCRFHIIS
jgi:hypothetical protein